MDVLHKLLLRQIKNQQAEILVSVVEKKLVASGFTLNRQQRNSLRRQLEHGPLTGLTLPGRTHQAEEKVELTITQSEVDELERRMTVIFEGLPETINTVADKIALMIRKDLDKRWVDEQRRREKELAGFRKRLQVRWREPLSKLRQLIVILTELGESTNARLRKQRRFPLRHVLEAQTRLHARACQVANEVVSLLEAGFADGAMARWRSLHELVVVSMFIGRDDALAERYLLHEVVESLRIASVNERHAERLELERVPAAKLASLQNMVNFLKARFGRPYGEQYGWAADVLGNPRPTFDQIEARAELEHMRPYYRLASHGVHANPKGAAYKLGLIKQRKVLLAGPTNYGLADPGQNTALSLTQVSAALANVEPTLDGITTLKIALGLSHEVGDSFVRVQREIEAEERQAARTRRRSGSQLVGRKSPKRGTPK